MNTNKKVESQEEKLERAVQTFETALEKLFGKLRKDMKFLSSVRVLIRDSTKELQSDLESLSNVSSE